MNPLTRRRLAAALLMSGALGLHAPQSAGAAAPLPERLGDTGLYLDGSLTTVHPDVLPFSPQYPLWSDGATKRRWIWIPPGAFIDASNPNAWVFPVGTRLWKEFSMGRRVETRFVERIDDGSWRFATYVWSEDGHDARLAPGSGIAALPVRDAPNGRYSIPSAYDCRACHEGAPSPVLGFSALQLSSDRDPLAPHAEPPDAETPDLAKLVARGWLRHLPQPLLEDPPRIAAPTPVARAALGYLHGNCGHCHADPALSGAAVPVAMVLAHDITDAASARKTLRALIGASSRFVPHGGVPLTRLVVPGDARASVLALRMRSRDPRVQMPPLGTAIADADGLALIERWIDETLPPEPELYR